MKLIIKQIAIFKESGEKRHIEFNDGLNIITGDSKTGKSALIEIVDYCLFSSRSSIPKGKITNYASLFVVIYQLEDHYLIVGRPSPEGGNINEAYFSLEFEYDDNLKDLQYEYFNEISAKPIKGDVQTDFERHIGLSIEKLDTENEKKLGKLSIRDAVSFLFQHQNLIANKHALFYRFDDFNKRKRIIEAFPVLFGSVDENYYELTRKVKELETKIKAEKKIIQTLRGRKEDEIKNLRDLIQLYYSMLGKTLEDDLSLPELKKISINLPLPPIIIDNQSKLFKDLNEFQKQLNEKYSERAEIEKAINSIYDNDGESLDYVKELVKIHSKQNDEIENHKDINCPLCNNNVAEINNNISTLHSSRQKLLEELKKLGTYSKDNTEIVSRFRKKKKEINKEINKLSKYISRLTAQNKAIKEGLNNREKLIFHRGVIQNTIENFLKNNSLKVENSDLNELLSELKINKESLAKYDIETFYRNSEVHLKGNMDRIANKLDFEKELKPIDFNFNLSDFSFYHENKGKIRLDEMGSGANWLACHLSIFLSFLHLNCANEKSVIPTFLILDQPSQVYFPKTANKQELEDEEAEEYDENIEQVKNLFRVMNEEIDLIEKNSGFRPQIIVLEHANDDDFSEFILRDWDKRKGQGLI
ncbi:DUF3732 domain-containing protein [Seonamhaeicola sp.]|uniref:DUF3732 domain-containing protein n=1 Tax=Seonamhaeicola sp. TaxID=1912245 RepID=UPI0026324208|nr:DUF3732 domain-containing protein [Seonamhaeicola sp.]